MDEGEDWRGGSKIRGMSTPEITPQTDKGFVFFRKIFDFFIKRGWLSWAMVPEFITHFTVLGEVEQDDLVGLMGCSGCEAHVTYGDEPILGSGNRTIHCPALQRKMVVWRATPCLGLYAK